MTVKALQVLIVDDQEDIRWALRTMLKRAGMKSYEASNGREAIDIVKSASPDAMLLDVKMPGMDGFEVFRPHP
ncbi:MAG: response regulator [Planctomycetota bacterium]|nr:response regulator [Planctomycetota bacterium]